MTAACLILTTFPDSDQAREIAEHLVERQLLACLNLLSSCESIYRWEGKLCRENEVPAIMKTSEDRVKELEAAFFDLHPYEVPEFLVIRSDSGSEAYLEWLARQTDGGVS